MIKYYYAFGSKFVAIAKMIELDEEVVLISINEEQPCADNCTDWDGDMQEFLKLAYREDYVGGGEISEEKYNNLKKFLNL